MGTVTGYTAAHMKTIEDTTVVSGSISGDNLILTLRNGGTINAGNVRGPQGVQGVGASDMTAVYQLLSPVGAMQPYGGLTAPSGWLMCDGSSLARSGTYAGLFTAIGSAYGSVDSTHFNVPDLRQRFPMGKGTAGTGSTLGATGGSNTSVLPSHSHSHSHTFTGNAVADHRHSIAGDGGYRIWVTAAIPQNNTVGPSNGLTGTSNNGNAVPTNMDLAGGHTPTGGNSTDATAAGVSPTDGNLPPYLVLNWIIRY